MRRHIGFKSPDVVMHVVGPKEWPILKKSSLIEPSVQKNSRELKEVEL